MGIMKVLNSFEKDIWTEMGGRIMTLYRHEMKMNLKSLIIWTLCVGGMCFGCILLYTSLEDSLQEIADVYANMGAMSTALGMDKMSLATLTGFYATEIAMMHGLGGAMFAAILGTGMLSKEEAGHTSEFLNVFPIGRGQIVIEKYLALLSNILLFNLVCALLYVLGFVMMGAGLGLVILLFAADMMCRIIPAIENVKYLTPFYYSNGADIFTNGEIDGGMLAIGIGMLCAAFVAAFLKYGKKDLAA